MDIRSLVLPLNMLRTLLLLSALLARTGVDAHAETPKYDVTYLAQSARVEVDLCLARAYSRVEFAADSPRAMRFIRDIRRTAHGDLKTAPSAWRARDWHAGECLKYSADIGAIADLHSDAGSRYGNVLVTDPQYWLLRADVQGESDAELIIDLPKGWSISAPWHEGGHGEKGIRFHIPNTPPDWSAAVALGPFEQERVAVPSGLLHVAILFDVDPKQRAKLIAWMQGAADALLKTYGRMPLEEVSVSIVSIDSVSTAARFFAFLYPAAVFGGESARGQGNSIQLVVDPRRPAVEFATDWTAIHELCHLMHPYLGDSGNWLAEGLATYYQNIARARAGLLTQAQAWEKLADGFRDAASAPSGETLEQASSSMSQTHAFRRVYWAGAAYWLTVDTDLRRVSGGALNLETALSRFHDCCLPAYREWQPQDFVAKLDELLAVQVFSRRYREFSQMTQFPDLHSLFSQLGIRQAGEKVTFDSDASDAAIREAISRTR